MGEARKRRDAELHFRSRPRGICQVCGGVADVKSHLFPRAISADIRADDKKLLVGSSDHYGRNMSQSGPWEYILCGAHEAMLHDYEDYAIKFVRGFSMSPAELRDQAFIRQDTDNDALVRFVCSILWRFHVSRLLEADKIYLPEWEPALRAVTFDGDMSKAPDVIVAAHVGHSFTSNRYVYPPFKSHFADRTTWQFVIHGVIFMAKLSLAPYPAPASLLTINGKREIWGRCKVADKQEWAAIREIAERMKPSHPLRRPAAGPWPQRL